MSLHTCILCYYTVQICRPYMFSILQQSLCKTSLSGAAAGYNCQGTTPLTG